MQNMSGNTFVPNAFTILGMFNIFPLDVVDNDKGAWLELLVDLFSLIIMLLHQKMVQMFSK